MKYYTCDECEWAGPFSDAAQHCEETGHDAFSRRDQEVDENQVQIVPQPYPYPVPVYNCDHSFSWMGVVPPTTCPKCGAWLRNWWPSPYLQPWRHRYYPSTPYWLQTTSGSDSSNNQISISYGNNADHLLGS